ncbi:MAG: YybH family protein, partial [Gemmatimonadales bacterium]
PYQRFAAAYASLDAERVSRIYTEDAFYLQPSGDMLRGRSAIRTRFAEAFDAARARRHTHRISFELVDRAVAGDLRNDIGYYTITTATPDGHEARFRGKFLKVWRRDGDGVWWIRTDSYSPAPP